MNLSLRIPIGRRSEKKTAVVVALVDGAVMLDDRRLSFDEAEAIAFALRDLALIVRAQHDVGVAEVA